MARASWLLLLLVPLAALSQTPGVSAHAPQHPRILATTLTAAPEEGTCADALQPAEWSDPSSGWTFAAHPTARLDDQELAATQLRGLIELRLLGSGLHLLVLGSDVRVRLSFSRAGWRPRWPFC